MAYIIEPTAPPTATTAPRTSGLRDARGCATGTGSAEALAHVEQALERMLSYYGDPLEPLARAAEADPSWGYPLVLQAAVLLTSSEYAPSRAAAEALAAAARLQGTGTDREKAHLAAARAASEGDWDTACDSWERILVEHPRDVAALLLAHLFDFYRGDALNLRRRPERVLPHWSPELPMHGYVLGMHAFGLEESGQYAAAEDTGRAALATNSRDPWAIHAVAHVFEMQGRHRQGSHWLASRAHEWNDDNGFAFHQWFHTALFQMERMDTDAALAVYDQHLAPATDMALQRVDGTAILWRLQLLGVDVADRFAALRRSWQLDAPEAGYYAFNDVHALLASIGGEPDLQAAGRLMAALTVPESSGATNRRMAADVGLPLARALMAYANRDWARAAEGLWQVRDRAHGFGGSHAQRDLITLVLLDAAARAGEPALACHVLNERRTAKAGTALTQYWQERIGRAAG